jgi:hypothetical protein
MGSDGDRRGAQALRQPPFFLELRDHPERQIASPAEKYSVKNTQTSLVPKGTNG